MNFPFFHFEKKRRRKSLTAERRLSFQQLEDRVLLAITDLRLVTYNALNFSSSSGDRQDAFQTVFDDLNADVVVLQEITSAGGADLLLGALNASNPLYASANFVNGNDTDHILFYNTSKVELVSQDYIPTALREIGEYTLSVDGEEFNVYSAHLKASQGSANEQLRLAEATVLRNHLETLPSDMEFILAGDTNIYRSSEPAYQKLTGSESNNDGRLEDLLPANLIGNWHENPAFASVHSQSPRTTSFGGGAAGGLDDRFDMIFGSFGLNDGFGVEYVTNSYFVHGNDGQHFNTSILDGSNNSASPAVIQALHDASDHLPVVADFQVVTGDNVGVTVVESGDSTNVAEGGAGDTYQIVLESVPMADVVVSISPDSQLDLGNGAGNPVALVFTPASALTPQTVFVSATDDMDVEGTHSGLIQHSVTSSDFDYDGFAVSDIEVGITDDDFIGSDFLLNEIYVNNPGGDGNHEFIEIIAAPLTPLVDVWLLEIEGDGPNAGTVDNGQNLSSLTTGSNGLVLLGQNYSSSTPWGAAVDPATTLSDLVGGTIENGTITFMLVQGYTGSNGVDLDADNNGQLDSTPWVSVLDSVGWADGGGSDRVYSPVILTQSGVPDAATRIVNDDRPEEFDAWFNGDISGSTDSTVYGNGSSGLPAGAEITPGSINFGDPGPVAGVTVVQTGGNTSLEEGGFGDLWTVVLDSVPASNVIVSVTPDSQVDLGAGVGNPVELVFTPADALTPQMVVVVAVDDMVAEGGHTSTIVQAATSKDSNYNEIAVSDIVATIIDNDFVGVTITQTNGSTGVSEAGVTDTYSVVLTSVPTANVTVTINPGSQLDLGNGAGGEVSLVFSPSSALTPQIVVVSADDDPIDEGKHSDLIFHSVVSSDSLYNNLAVADVLVLIADNEPTGAVWGQANGGASGVVGGAGLDSGSRNLQSRTGQTSRAQPGELALDDVGLESEGDAIFGLHDEAFAKRTVRHTGSTTLIAGVQEEVRLKIILNELAAELDWLASGF